MTHKVLVLCQRRSSEVDDLHLINENINALATQLLGDDIEIKYLTSGTLKGTSDFVGIFGDNEWTRENLIKQDYSLIICNTCPFITMNYAILNEYLQNEGFLALAAYQNTGLNNGDEIKEKVLKHPMFKSAISSKGFEQRDDVNNTVIFQKVSAPTGGKINKKSKKSKRSRRSRRSRRSKRSRK